MTRPQNLKGCSNLLIYFERYLIWIPPPIFSYCCIKSAKSGFYLKWLYTEKYGKFSKLPKTVICYKLPKLLRTATAFMWLSLWDAFFLWYIKRFCFGGRMVYYVLVIPFPSPWDQITSLFQMFRFSSLGMRTSQTKTKKRRSTLKRQWPRLLALKKKNPCRKIPQVEELNYLPFIFFWPSKMNISISRKVLSSCLQPSSILFISEIEY